MACIAMAYIVMAECHGVPGLPGICSYGLYIIMACIAMAYIVMAECHGVPGLPGIYSYGLYILMAIYLRPI